jgi:uncharacterized protein
MSGRESRITAARLSASALLWLGALLLHESQLTPAFAQEDVSFPSGDNTLKGVLVLLQTRGPHPAVAFVHGSGALRRDDWTSHPALREHLARHGIASLCWDKPGVGASTGSFDTVRRSFCNGISS